MRWDIDPYWTDIMKITAEYRAFHLRMV